MWRQIAPAFRITALFTILTGLIYPALVTAVCQALFPFQANGSLIRSGGAVIGSTLIGQNFHRPEYLQPRPSAAGNDGYDATASGGSNLGPTNPKLIDRVRAAAAQFRRENPSATGPLPADLLTTSASGLDPDLSPESALLQADRIAAARQAREAAVRELIEKHITGRAAGLLGEPRVNVIETNLDLDRRFPKH